MSYFATRDLRTSLNCPECGKNLHIKRNCYEVFMQCPDCNRKYPLKEFISKADKAMEEFLENVYCDRI